MWHKLRKASPAIHEIAYWGTIVISILALIWSAISIRMSSINKIADDLEKISKKISYFS